MKRGFLLILVVLCAVFLTAQGCQINTGQYNEDLLPTPDAECATISHEDDFCLDSTERGSCDSDGVYSTLEVCLTSHFCEDTVSPPSCVVIPADVDSDGDGILDSVDVCPDFDDADDADGDGIPDGCDACHLDADNDADADGICDNIDPCVGDSTQDVDGNGVSDCEDTLSDYGFCETKTPGLYCHNLGGPDMIIACDGFDHKINVGQNCLGSCDEPNGGDAACEGPSGTVDLTITAFDLNEFNPILNELVFDITIANGGTADLSSPFISRFYLKDSTGTVLDTCINSIGTADLSSFNTNDGLDTTCAFNFAAGIAAYDAYYATGIYEDYEAPSNYFTITGSVDSDEVIDESDNTNNGITEYSMYANVDFFASALGFAPYSLSVEGEYISPVPDTFGPSPVTNYEMEFTVTNAGPLRSPVIEDLSIGDGIDRFQDLLPSIDPDFPLVLSFQNDNELTVAELPSINNFLNGPWNLLLNEVLNPTYSDSDLTFYYSIGELSSPVAAGHFQLTLVYPACVDYDDGDDITERSHVVENRVASQNDQCGYGLDAEKVIERTCSGDVIHDCVPDDMYCRQGICVPPTSCIDDGTTLAPLDPSYLSSGYAQAYNGNGLYAKGDTCVTNGGPQLIEYYCASNYMILETTINCNIFGSGWHCQSGECVP
jgi:hypothetical protein